MIWRSIVRVPFEVLATTLTNYVGPKEVDRAPFLALGNSSFAAIAFFSLEFFGAAGMSARIAIGMIVEHPCCAGRTFEAWARLLSRSDVEVA